MVGAKEDKRQEAIDRGRKRMQKKFRKNDREEDKKQTFSSNSQSSSSSDSDSSSNSDSDIKSEESKPSEIQTLSVPKKNEFNEEKSVSQITIKSKKSDDAKLAANAAAFENKLKGFQCQLISQRETISNIETLMSRIG